MQLSGKVSHYDSTRGEGAIESKSLGGTVRFQSVSLVDVKRVGPGDLVQFELGHIRGVGQAVRVILVAEAKVSRSEKQLGKAFPPPRRADKTECGSCHKLMIPRLVMADGRPERSFCPFCGSVFKDFRAIKKSGVVKKTAEAAVGAALAGFLTSFISF